MVSMLLSSINGDGAAEQVQEHPDEQGEEECEGEEFAPSWPATFTSASSDAEESGAHKGVTTDGSGHEQCFFALCRHSTDIDPTAAFCLLSSAI